MLRYLKASCDGVPHFKRTKYLTQGITFTSVDGSMGRKATRLSGTLLVLAWLAIIGLAARVDAANASQNPAVGLDPAGETILALLTAFLVGLALVTLVTNSSRKHLVLELAARISASAAILLMTILVIAGITVDRTAKHQMDATYAFLVSLVTIVCGISGLIIASLCRLKWAEGPIR